MGKVPDWAVGPFPKDSTEPGVEVRLNPDKTIDEVLFSLPGGAFFHLEQMDTGQYWIGVSWTDESGEDRMQHMMLSTARNTRIYPTVYR